MKYKQLFWQRIYTASGNAKCHSKRKQRIKDAEEAKNKSTGPRAVAIEDDREEDGEVVETEEAGEEDVEEAGEEA